MAATNKPDRENHGFTAGQTLGRLVHPGRRTPATGDSTDPQAMEPYPVSPSMGTETGLGSGRMAASSGAASTATGKSNLAGSQQSTSAIGPSSASTDDTSKSGNPNKSK